MNNELIHYGVKGMRWGVRRNPNKSFSRGLVKKNLKKGAEEGANDAVNKLRMRQLQKKYKESDPKTARAKEGAKFVLEVLKEIGKNTLNNIGSQFGPEESESVAKFLNTLAKELEGRSS